MSYWNKSSGNISNALVRIGVRACDRSTKLQCSRNIDSPVASPIAIPPHFASGLYRLVKNSLGVHRRAQDERRGFDIIDDFPFMLKLSKHLEPFSTTCLLLTSVVSLVYADRHVNEEQTYKDMTVLLLLSHIKTPTRFVETTEILVLLSAS
jgi:hypothetical protein